MTDQRTNVQTSFNDDFCSWLEHYLSRAFENSGDNILKYLWCDGVDEPVINEQFTSVNIGNVEQITTIAWIGSDGVDRYDMVIKLGRNARRRALMGLSIEICSPDAELQDWVEIDLENLRIEIQLY